MQIGHEETALFFLQIFLQIIDEKGILANNGSAVYASSLVMATCMPGVPNRNFAPQKISIVYNKGRKF